MNFTTSDLKLVQTQEEYNARLYEFCIKPLVVLTEKEGSKLMLKLYFIDPKSKTFGSETKQIYSKREIENDLNDIIKIINEFFETHYERVFEIIFE